MALGGSYKFRTTTFILHMRKYSTVKNLIMKYFRHSYSSKVQQPSELVQGSFEVDVNITMYMKQRKPSQSGVGHCQSKWSLAPFQTAERPLSSAGCYWKCAEDFYKSCDIWMHGTNVSLCVCQTFRQAAFSMVLYLSSLLNLPAMKFALQALWRWQNICIKV